MAPKLKAAWLHDSAINGRLNRRESEGVPLAADDEPLPPDDQQEMLDTELARYNRTLFETPKAVPRLPGVGRTRAYAVYGVPQKVKDFGPLCVGVWICSWDEIKYLCPPKSGVICKGFEVNQLDTASGHVSFKTGLAIKDVQVFDLDCVAELVALQRTDRARA